MFVGQLLLTSAASVLYPEFGNFGEVIPELDLWIFGELGVGYVYVDGRLPLAATSLVQSGPFYNTKITIGYRHFFPSKEILSNYCWSLITVSARPSLLVNVIGGWKSILWFITYPPKQRYFFIFPKYTGIIYIKKHLFINFDTT